MNKVLLFLGITAFLTACNSNSQTKDTPVVVNSKAEAHTIPNLPATIDFAGSTLILEDEDVIERLDREVLVNAYYQSATTQYLKRANRWFPLIERILKEEGIPKDFKYLAVIESGLVQAVSPAGAQGFWQFMPKTAAEFGLQITPEVDERLDVEKSTRAACAYLKKAKDTLKDWMLAAAAYNRGFSGVRSDMRWQGASHYFDMEQNSETGRYVYRLLAIKLIFENPKAYGFNTDKIKLYEPFQTKTVLINESVPNLAQWALEHGINYKILVKLNPWLKTNKLTVKNKSFDVLLPSEKENLKPYARYLK